MSPTEPKSTLTSEKSERYIHYIEIPLKIAGCWDLFPNTSNERRLIFNNIYLGIVLFVLTHIPMMLIVHLYNEWQDIMSSLATIADSLPLIVSLVIVAYYAVYRKDLYQLLEYMDKNFKHHSARGLTNMTMVQSYLSARSFARIYTACTLFSVTMYATLPVIIHLWTKEPIQGWIYIGVTCSPYYEFTFLLSCVAQLFVGLALGQFEIIMNNMNSPKFYDIEYQSLNEQELMLNIGSMDPPFGLHLEDIPSSFTSIPSPESETMDIACKPCPQDFSVTPFSPRGPPERNSYAGDLNFCVEVNSNDVHKKTFLEFLSCSHGVWICARLVDGNRLANKALMLVSDATVSRVKPGIPREIAKNVLHSSREIGTQGVYYCGNVDVADSWYSVLVEFSRTSPEPCSHAYQFSCKNSCATGINRRAIAIIFTLEDDVGRVYGRQKVGARVCACPRRDMLKDETAEGVYKTGKKRIPSNQIQPSKVKKIKVENLMDFDDTVFKLPPLQIVGSRATICGLKMMLEMMELALEFRKNDPEAAGLYDKPIADLREAIKKMEKAKTTSE